MTRDEIIELAKQVGCATNQIMFGRTDYCVMTEFVLERFAQLVAASEREAQMTEYGKACRARALAEAAGLCRNEQWDHQSDTLSIRFIDTYNGACDDCANAIGRLA